MDLVFVLTTVILIVAFMLYKKSDEKLSFIKWLIIAILTIISYNIAVGIIFGLLAVSSNMVMLSIINIIFSALLCVNVIRKKEIQKYYFSKLEILGLVVITAIFGVMLIKDMKIQDGSVVHVAIDSSIHYRAAKHYSDTMLAFINVEDKTFFDFNIMQPGAYINNGLMMHVLYNMSNGAISYVHIYELFECLMVYMCGLGFYAIIIDKIKGKWGFILSMAFFALFLYAYPYNSYMYGFSYLTVGMVTITALMTIVPMLYSRENIKKNFVLILIGITATGLIFSYCLFAPIVFAAICLFALIRDLKEDDKKFLKIFGMTTLKVGIVLFLIAIVGVCYLMIPAHFITDQSTLSSAIKNEGAVYDELWRDIIYYVPFGVLFIVELIKKLAKKEKLEFLDIFAVLYGVFFVVMWLGMRLEMVSTYYFYKTYFALWIIILAVTVELINKYVNSKEDKVMKVGVSIYSAFWPVFVVAMIIIKASTLLPEETKHSITNYIGMYYSENCEFRGSMLATLDFNNDMQELAEYFRTHIEDATADNTVLITKSYNQRCWATVTTELSSENMEYREVIQDTLVHNIRELHDHTSKKYAISFVGSNDYDNWINQDEFKLIFQNDAGYIVEKVDN